MQRRQLGNTDIFVTPIALGCWPIAGMTSLGVNEADSVATLEAAFEHGINFFDTAYCYGADGESERLIARVLGKRRDEIVIATKGGIHWDAQGKQAHDASPVTLRRQLEESLRRLATDRVDLLYLHAPDPAVPIEKSAEELRQLLEEGKTRSVGVSNVTVQEMDAFANVCPIAACQMPYNMLQREIEADVLPWCDEHNIAMCAYWPLLKGLLAGHLPRDFVFRPGDGRAKYVMFQGDEWQRNQDLLDELRLIAAEAAVSVSQLAIAWTIAQPGLTVALCGAKRPSQIIENAGGDRELPAEVLARVDAALAARGKPLSQGAVR